MGHLGSAARMRICKFGIVREIWKKSVAILSIMYNGNNCL